MPVQVNPDLSVSYQVPGIYAYISTVGGGPTASNRRVLFYDYKTSAGTAEAGVPKRVNNEEEVVQFAGKGSNVHRSYRAYQAQGAIGAENWICPMAAPSGTAQTRLIKIMALAASGALGSNTTASAAGILTVWVEGYRADVIVANGDTFATIATNLLAELLKFEDFVGFTFTRSTDTITCTARHAALTSADSPIVVTYSTASMAIAASPGTLTFANAAGADGTVILYCATQSVSYAIPNGTAVNTIAANVITAINAANAFPLTAAQTAPGAVVTLFYVNDRVCNWLATAITPAATITTTLAAAVGNHAAGLPSSSSPSLSTALSNIANQGAYRLWITSFNGAGSYITDATYTQIGSATDYSALGTISAKVESQGNGVNCKGQSVIFGDTRSLATAGAVPVGTSPALTASPRYMEIWAPACPQQGVEMAARCAARIISQDFLPRNYAGMTLTTDEKVPLLGTHAAVSMSDSDANAAMLSYFMTPVRMNSDNMYAIVSGRTTAKPGSSMDVRFVFWGVIITQDYFRDDLRSYLGGLLKGKSIKRYSQPVTSDCVSPEAVRDLCHGRMLTWDGLDYFDGADRLKDFVESGVNSFLPSRLDVSMPICNPIPLEQVSIFFKQVA